MELPALNLLARHSCQAITINTGNKLQYMFTPTIIGVHTHSALVLLLALCCVHQQSNSACIPYRLYIAAQKHRFLPCGVTARTKYICLFWGCGIEKRGFLAYFGACQAKIPVRSWCKSNTSRVRGWCGSVSLKYFFGAAVWTRTNTHSALVYTNNHTALVYTNHHSALALFVAYLLLKWHHLSPGHCHFHTATPSRYFGRTGCTSDWSLLTLATSCMYRVGQNHICTVHIRYFWQGNHQIYGHIRCINTVLANPMYVLL